MDRSKIFKIASTLVIFIGAVIGVYLVGIKTGFINKASGVTADIVVDAGNTFKNPGDCWRNLAQGGESGQRMLSGVIPQVKKLGPNYIRIDHIFDHYELVSKDGGGNINLNWTKLDETVNDIRATGATPFLSLSYMPIPLSADGTVTGKPANWSDWEYLVQKTIEHYSGTLGISGVYYEVWNEPDLFGEFKNGGAKSYPELYVHSVNAASRAAGVKYFKIGGPGTSGLYKNWIETMLNLTQNKNVRVDFLSWHNYYMDSDRYDKDIQNIFNWISSHPEYVNIELVVSEMGIDPKNNSAYDGNLSAINTISAVTALQGNVNKCFTFEIIDGEGPSKFWGRWGILTHGKFGTPEEKPRYRALQFLNRMQGDRISVRGSGSWVKAFGRHDGKNLRVLVSNYAPDGHQEAVPLKLINIPYKKFLVKTIRFLGATSTQSVEVDGDSWSTELGMSPNTAVIVEVTPE